MRSRKLLTILAFVSVFIIIAALASGCGKKKEVKATIVYIEPSTAAPGATVQIKGVRFGSAQGNSTVSIGGKTANVVGWTDTVITAKVPSGLGAAPQGVTVMTDQGESNEKDLTVTSGGKQPNQPQKGDIEHVTPVQAMIAYENKKGVSTAGWIFSVVQVSNKDPNWKIDVGSTPGGQPTYFLLHNENGNWVVKDDGKALTKQELASKGAPSDLYGTPPPPTTQAQAVWDYMQKQGINPAGVTVSITRISSIDPSWQEGTADRTGAPDEMVVFHKENGNWVVKALSTNITSDQLAQLGAPKDLTHTPTEAQAIANWINAGNAEPGVTAAGWALSVVKVSRIDPDWEIVKGTQAGSGTMYFLLHWENGAWVVRDDGGALTPQEISAQGAPSDLP